MYSIYQPGTNTPHRRSTHVRWFPVEPSYFSKRKAGVDWRRHWNAINRWGRAFTRAGPAVREVRDFSNLVKLACSPNTGTGSGHVTCPTARTEPHGSWCTGCWCPADASYSWCCCILVSCVMKQTSVLIETLSTSNIWLHDFLPSFDRTDHMLNFISQNPSCFVFIFLTEATHWWFILRVWSTVLFEPLIHKVLPLQVHSCYTCGIILLLSAPISTN